jgi:lipopolysaccharide/colanic/teichoic acid biosynthesis glycosyltransferase
MRRVTDVVISAVALVLCVPLFAAIAVAISLESPGGVFFFQERVGKDLRPFRIVKFRSMAAGSGGAQVTGRVDPRVTRVGRLLRTTKLDEFPQLWNVLKGEMTLFGSRAEVPDMVREYRDDELEILRWRPGITGPGQIFYTTDQSALLDEAEDADAFYVQHLMHAKLAIDLAYLREQTWRIDVVVLAQTVRMLVLALGIHRHPAPGQPVSMNRRP